ncbi:MAG: DsbA family protein [Proteobacteria bacterium]|nr:DsbA family protein [Pseudomonadota bacterium]
MKNFKKIYVFAIALCLLIGFAALIVNNYKTKTSFKNNKEEIAKNTEEKNPQDSVNKAVNDSAAQNIDAKKSGEILKVNSSDIVLGDKNAPVVLIEYASLSCPHCAAFHRESLEKLKNEYIDAKKVQFIHRDFPLNQPALVAGMLAICQAQDHKEELSEKYYSALKALFRTQDSWAFDAKYIEKLQSIMQLDGMSVDRFNSCIDDKKLQEKILSERMEASKGLQIQSTPSFFINGEIMEGYVDYLSLKKIIDKKLAQPSK